MRNYKTNILITYISVFYLILFVILIIFIFSKKYYTYNYYKGIYLSSHTFEVYVKKKDLKYLEKNPYIYLNSKREKIEILEKDNVSYKNLSLIIMKSRKVNKKTKLNISIYNDKKSIYSMLIKPWKEKKWN